MGSTIQDFSAGRGDLGKMIWTKEGLGMLGYPGDEGIFLLG